MSTPAASRPAARQAAVDAVGRRTLDSILEAAASGREDDVLIQLPDGGQLSYRDVLDRRTAYAAALEQRGVQPGNAVAVHMTASPELVLLMFGLYRLGVLAAMSNPVNTVHELRAVLRRSEARLLVVDDDLVSIAASLEAEIGRAHV